MGASIAGTQARELLNAEGVSLSAESDEGSRPLRYEFALQTHLDLRAF